MVGKAADPKYASRPSFQISTEAQAARPSSTISDNALQMRSGSGYEEVYLKDYRVVPEAQAGIRRWFQFYNHERPHQALGYQTPFAVYQAG